MSNYNDNIGRYARSIESGWVGKIVAVEYHDGPNEEPFYKMQGVNEMVYLLEERIVLDDDDTQWFTPSDVRLLVPTKKFVAG